MTMSDAELRIESYLSRMLKHLRRRPAGNWNESVAELRSHIVERATVGGEMTEARVEAVLRCLGSPEDLAEQYLTDALPWDSEVNRARSGNAHELSRWAELIGTSVPVLLFATFGYFLGAALLICALSKLFHPDSAGLWSIPDLHDINVSLRLGFSGRHPPVGSVDLLGWWVIPIGLLSGYVMLTIGTHLALWTLRLFRRFRAETRDQSGGLVYGGQ
jgi:hypothetical protein